MKKGLAILIMMLMGGLIHAGPGPLFTTAITQSSITITPTARHYYPSMGIKITTPGVTVSGCTPHSNGYCLFSASNTTPKTLIFTGLPRSLEGIICLDGQGVLSCQRFGQDYIAACQTGTNGECGVFIRSTAVSGAFAGIIAGNGRCQATATVNGFPGVWRAWISTTTVNAITNILYNDSLTYVRATSPATIIALPGELMGTHSSFPLTETGAAPVPSQIYTGTLSTGTNSGLNCTSWTTASAVITATFGLYNALDQNWTNSGSISCSNMLHLYCFEAPS